MHSYYVDFAYFSVWVASLPRFVHSFARFRFIHYFQIKFDLLMHFAATMLLMLPPQLLIRVCWCYYSATAAIFSALANI